MTLTLDAPPITFPVPPDLIGEQEPRIIHRPVDIDPVLSLERHEEMSLLAEIAGIKLDPWQETGAEALTYTRPDGRWSAFEAFVAANRQQGKGTIIEARQLAGLFVWEEPLQLYTAHEFRTAQEMFLRIQSLIESTPSLDRLVARIRTADGEEAIETKNGCRLKFMARSGSSGRGFTAPALYLDEAMKLKRRMVAAIMPTMSALSMEMPVQIMYFSSAGEQDSEVQESIRQRALKGDARRLTYVEWSAPRWDELPKKDQERWPTPQAYRSDPEVHRRANPGWNLRLDPEFVLAELEALTTDGNPESFDRERLGIWAKIGGDGEIPLSTWNAGLIEDKATQEELETAAMTSERLAFGVDIPKSRDSASIVMAYKIPDTEQIFWLLVDRKQGTDWLPERLAELKAKYTPLGFWGDELAQTITFDKTLRRAGVRLRWLNFKQYTQACAWAYDAIMGEQILHEGQEELTAAVENAKRKATVEAQLWKWARGGVADISPLVAATLAYHGLRTAATGKTKVVTG